LEKHNIDEILNSWLGVKFTLQGRTKEKGCDCIGLVLGVAHEIDHLSKLYGYAAYEIEQPQYTFHSNPNQIKNALDEHFYPSKDGEIIFLNYGKYKHLGILTHDHQRIVHSHFRIGKVISNEFNDFFQNRIMKRYSFWSKQ
jgi:cell wall-associated NlpC family hydrolase